MKVYAVYNTVAIKEFEVDDKFLPLLDDNTWDMKMAKEMAEEIKWQIDGDLLEINDAPNAIGAPLYET